MTETLKKLARTAVVCGGALSTLLTPGMLAAQAAAPAAAHVATLTISSPSLKDGSAIPSQFTCAAGPTSGSPEISWTGVPPEAKSVVVYLHDLDPHPNGGIADILHWVVWNVPASVTMLPAGIKNEAAAVPGSVQGTNTHNTVGYFGPCPPVGSPDHHYVFEVFALSKSLDLTAKASRTELMNVMDGSIVGHGVMVTTFHRAQ